MADISDVLSALRTVVASAIYPNGKTQPSTLPPATGSTTPQAARIYSGWPNSAKLEADMLAGITNINVFSKTGMTRNTTRYEMKWEDIVVAVPTITAAVSGSVATFGGVAGPSQIAGIRARGVAYAYVTSPTDTPTTIAAALSALVLGSSAAGPSVTVAGADDIEARVVGINTAMLETRRQNQEFLIGFWTPTPGLRHVAAGLVDTALSQMNFIPLADGGNGRLLYVGDFIDDMVSKEATWRRDLYYTVEFPTTVVQLQPTMLWGLTGLTPAAGAIQNLIA